MSHANSNFNGNYILRIPLSSDFLQIIGRKQIDGGIQKSGSILKVYPRSNLTQIWPKLCSKTILSRAKIFLCERIRQIRLIWRSVQLGSVICGSPSCMPCSLSLLLSESDRYFENIAFASLKSPK